MEPQLPSLCHQTPPELQKFTGSSRNLSKAERSANQELVEVKALAWSNGPLFSKKKESKL